VRKISLTEQVASTCNIDISEVNTHAVSRMVKKYSVIVDLAIRNGDDELLADCYRDALSLPSVQTSLELENNGFILDGVLISANKNLQICFKKSVPHVLKVCSREEYTRAEHFQNAVREAEWCEWVTSFELYNRMEKFYMFMPLLPTSLEHLRTLDETTSPLLWTCLSGALDFLHSYGYAHNDVKPPNILISTTGEFILADLGSLVPFGRRSASTPAYIPREFYNRRSSSGPLASRRADYWMLAMTIFEKACEGELGGAESPKKDTILEAIRTHPNCSDFSSALLDRLEESI
jgi:serine/threonine protein kinase